MLFKIKRARMVLSMLFKNKHQSLRRTELLKITRQGIS